jgi:hypothetical protein
VLTRRRSPPPRNHIVDPGICYWPPLDLGYKYRHDTPLDHHARVDHRHPVRVTDVANHGARTISRRRGPAFPSPSGANGVIGGGGGGARSGTRPSWCRRAEKVTASGLIAHPSNQPPRKDPCREPTSLLHHRRYDTPVFHIIPISCDACWVEV